jgi:hypothetical protein
MTTEHVCDLGGVWPIGHPLPAEDPARLQGPEVGTHPIYVHKTRTGKMVDGAIVWTETVEHQPSTVLARSYVWSPGECRAKGGYRRYDWTVISTVGDGRAYTVVVDDTDLIEVEAPAYANMTDIPTPEAKRA